MAEEKKTTTPKQASSASDAEKNKVYGVLAYIGILFIVPLLAAPESKFAKFHANQGCVLFIAGILLSLVAWIPVIGWLVGFVGWIALLVLAIMGIVNAVNGKMEKLPIIGEYEIIK